LSIFTFIPVKDLKRAKSRLSPILQPEERKLFCLKMLADVVNTVKHAKCIQKTIVVSKDNEVLSFSEKLQVSSFKERGFGLNRALSEAIKCYALQEATSALILPADIPLVKPEDIIEFSLLKEKNSIVISPSRDEKGTNALLMKLPNVLPLLYGKHSFQLFVKEAKRKGLSIHIVRSKRLGLDVDTVKDLADFLANEAECSQAYQFLKEINISKRLENYKKR